MVHRDFSFYVPFMMTKCVDEKICQFKLNTFHTWRNVKLQVWNMVFISWNIIFIHIVCQINRYKLTVCTYPIMHLDWEPISMTFHLSILASEVKVYDIDPQSGCIMGYAQKVFDLKFLKEYSVILTTWFYGINQKINKKKEAYFQNFSWFQLCISGYTWLCVSLLP